MTLQTIIGRSALTGLAIAGCVATTAFLAPAQPAQAQARGQSCKSVFDANKAAIEAAAGRPDGRASIQRIMASSGCRDIPVTIAKPTADLAGKPRVVIRCWIVNNRIHCQRINIDA